jgi:hypothetical protein
MIGYGDTVSVSAGITKNMLGAPEWGLGIDDPILAKELPDPRGERPVLSEEFQLSVKTELSLSIGVLKTGNKLAPKDAAKDSHRKALIDVSAERQHSMAIRTFRC